MTTRSSSTPSASSASGIPRLPGVDSSAAFLKDGYEFGLQRFRGDREDAFRTRILGRKAVVMRGADAARIFYDGDRFSRERAMPSSLQHLLQDEGSVQDHEGEVHHHRKKMFAALLMEDEALATLRTLYAQEWDRACQQWREQGGSVVLHDALAPVLTRVALRWMGIDPDAVDVAARATELAEMISKAATIGPPNWIARARRRRTERWAATLVTGVRTGAISVAADSPLAAIAHHRDPDGEMLPPEVAAVEIINVLRPTVAVARFIVFAAYALHRRPEWAERFRGGDTEDVWGFVQEVRRYYPFFPVVAGTAQRDFTWHGHEFSRGDWVVLDLFATNHDSRLWPQPKTFDPSRFRDWDGDANALIPQGAGDVHAGHRCPGERATIALMEEAVLHLTQGTDYRVPEQDLRISLTRFPALPASGFVIDVASTTSPTPAGRVTGVSTGTTT